MTIPNRPELISDNNHILLIPQCEQIVLHSPNYSTSRLAALISFNARTSEASQSPWYIIYFVFARETYTIRWNSLCTKEIAVSDTHCLFFLCVVMILFYGSRCIVCFLDFILLSLTIYFRWSIIKIYSWRRQNRKSFIW